MLKTPPLAPYAATKTDDLAAFMAPFEEYTLEQWRKVMAVNLDGTVEPRVASRWTRRDERTWEFTLRRDLNFVDGTPLDAPLRESIELRCLVIYQ